MKKKTMKPQKGPVLTGTYETEIEFTCPVRGKVRQKVQVKKYQSIETQAVNEILPSNSLSEKLDLQYSGLLLDDDSVDGEDGGEA